MDSKIESIIEFSGLRRVIDQPFRTYSSGMKARLTFSTAVSVDPDILIIDEALAAGDVFFVGKCLNRIGEICKSGATVLFVSHSTSLVQRFCRRCIHIDQGRVVDIGDALDVTSRYESLAVQEQMSQMRSDIDDVADQGARETAESETFDVAAQFVGPGARDGRLRGWTASGTVLQIEAIRMIDEEGAERQVFSQQLPLRIRIAVRAQRPVRNPALYLKIVRSDGILVHTFNSQDPHVLDFGLLGAGKHELEVAFPKVLLGDGVYYVSVHLYPEYQDGTLVGQAYTVHENRAGFEVKRRRPLSSVIDHPLELYCDGRLVGGELAERRPKNAA